VYARRRRVRLAVNDGDLDTDVPDRVLGTTIADKYEVVRLLGRGGMGRVYEARHVTLSRRFAIKLIAPELALNREVLRRFENEAKAAGQLEHPNLVAVTDFGRVADGSPFMVMEYLEGESCAALLKRTGPLPVPRAAGIVVQACRGVARAHKSGIIHRDLKPENIFIADAGDGTDLVKVLDFGIAKLRPVDATAVTKTGTAMGTASYMSPEQARGESSIDHRTDVWSLGVVLYELLTGHKPFEGDEFLHIVHRIATADPVPLQQRRPDLPPGLVQIVQRAMAKDLGDRTPTVVALAEDLAPFTGRGEAAENRTSAAAVVVRSVPADSGDRPIDTALSHSGPIAADGVPGAPRPDRSGIRRAVVIGLSVAALAAIGAVALLARGPAAPPAPNGLVPTEIAPAAAPPATAARSAPAVEQAAALPAPSAQPPDTPAPSAAPPSVAAAARAKPAPTPRPISSAATRPPRPRRPAGIDTEVPF
jgi:eukaryotic-like serine/threonine-protein kinase